MSKQFLQFLLISICHNFSISEFSFHQYYGIVSLKSITDILTIKPIEMLLFCSVLYYRILESKYNPGIKQDNTFKLQGQVG